MVGHPLRGRCLASVLVVRYYGTTVVGRPPGGFAILRMKTARGTLAHTVLHIWFITWSWHLDLGSAVTCSWGETEFGNVASGDDACLQWQQYSRRSGQGVVVSVTLGLSVFWGSLTRL